MTPILSQSMPFLSGTSKLLTLEQILKTLGLAPQILKYGNVQLVTISFPYS